MPCRVDDYPPSEQELHEQEAFRHLCALLKWLEEHHPVAYSGVRPTTKAWHLKHKAYDAERKQAEKRAKAAERARDLAELKRLQRKLGE